MNLLLKKIISKKNSHLCIGLDVTNEILKHHKKLNVEKFILKIVESTYDLTSAYKFNLGFYEYFGSNGLKVLEKVLPEIPSDILKIGDGKRGDIASTSKMYAHSLYEHFGFDAITLNPLMGYDSLQPFLGYKDKINFILVMTSNQGAKDFQKLKLTNKQYLYKVILKKIIEWNKIHKNLGVVIGATQKKEFIEIDASLRNISILIPGVGAQGGDLKFICNHLGALGLKNFLINSSRGILLSDTDNFYFDTVRKKAQELREKINYHLDEKSYSY